MLVLFFYYPGSDHVSPPLKLSPWPEPSQYLAWVIARASYVVSLLLLPFHSPVYSQHSSHGVPSKMQVRSCPASAEKPALGPDFIQSKSHNFTIIHPFIMSHFLLLSHPLCFSHESESLSCSSNILGILMP